MIEDEALLMAVLNSAPVSEGQATETLVGPDGAALAKRFGGAGSAAELQHLRDVRQALHRIVAGDGRGGQDAVTELKALLEPVSMQPRVSPDGVQWVLTAPPESLLAARVTFAWSQVAEEMPGRLRPCANADCNLYLLDHSRPGTARWCSMATCGNRAKARTHARRTRRSGPTSGDPQGATDR